MPMPCVLPSPDRALYCVVCDDRHQYGHTEGDGLQPALIETDRPAEDHKRRPVEEIERVRELTNVDGDLRAEDMVDDWRLEAAAPLLGGDGALGHE